MINECLPRVQQVIFYVLQQRLWGVQVIICFHSCRLISTAERSCTWDNKHRSNAAVTCRDKSRSTRSSRYCWLRQDTDIPLCPSLILTVELSWYSRMTRALDNSCQTRLYLLYQIFTAPISMTLIELTGHRVGIIQTEFKTYQSRNRNGMSRNLVNHDLLRRLSRHSRLLDNFCKELAPCV